MNKTFGKSPHVAWQLDPFGSSAVTPTLFSQYGFDTLFITRVGTNIKSELREKGHLQFIWKGHNSNDKLFVQVCQNEFYTVTHKIHYDRRIPDVYCFLKDLDKE